MVDPSKQLKIEKILLKFDDVDNGETEMKRSYKGELTVKRV